MSRHTDALLHDLRPQSSRGVSATSWVYLILGVLALGAGFKLYRKLQKAQQQRAWELEQRRRHGIPDDDKRPFKIAHRDAAVRARREAERSEATAKAEREQQKAKREEERKAAVEREWQRENEKDADQRPVRAGMRRRGPQASLDAASRGTSLLTSMQPTYVPEATSPRLPGAMPEGDAQSEQQAQYQPEMRQVARPAQASRKRAVDEDDEEEVAGPARRRKIELPRGTKRSAESEEEDDAASIAHRAKIRAGKQRQVSPDAEDDDEMNDGDYQGGSDKENEPEDEDETMDSEPESGNDDMDQDDEPSATQTPRRRTPLDKRKKRLIEEVDAESAVGSSGGRPRADRKRRKNRDERLPEAESFQEGSDEEPQAAPLRRKTSKRQSRTLRRVPPAQASGLQRRDSQIVRKPGDEWTDKAGLKWRWGEDGHKRRSVAVKEVRKRYDMPKDSKHPDANVTMQVLVEKWLTEDEYEQARAERKLAWQLDEDEETPTTPSAAPEASRKKSLYHLKGSVNPLRSSTSMVSLVGRVARNVTPLRRSYMTSGSLAGLADSGSSAPASPADLSQSHSRARLGPPSRPNLAASASKKPLTEEERKKREAELVRKLTQPDKSATPVAPAPAALPTATPAASTPGAATSAPSFSFGASPALAATETKPAEAPKATFSFGAAPAKAEPSTTTSAAAPASTFSFGAGKIENPAEAKPAALFSFGGPSPAPAPATNAAPAAAAPPTFSFGASSAKPAEAAPTAAAPAAFSFGASSASPAPVPAATATGTPSFSFGASSTAAPAGSTPPVSTPPASASTFSFGASSTAPKPAAPTTSTPSFSFGASTTTSAPAPATFSFGAGGSTPSGPTAPAAAPPTFSFGAATPAAPTPAAAPAAASSFSFGAGGAAPAAGGFSFGSGGSTGSTFTFGKK